MTKEFKTLSKLSRLRLFRILPRDRLFRLLDAERREHPVVWIAGPPGAGKTAPVANYQAVQNCLVFGIRLTGAIAIQHPFSIIWRWLRVKRWLRNG
jgi:hypothetical protein